MSAWPTDARWIWLAGADEAVDCYFLFRCSFELSAPPKRAVLRVTASQSYRLWVNGRFAGRGPVPSDPAWQHFDEIDIAPFLVSGRNVLALLVHNHGLSTHDLPATRGGLLCELVAGDVHVFSDSSWKVKRSQRHALNAPRRFWSAGFAEVADSNRDEGWELPEYDDSYWVNAAELGAHPVWPWSEFLPRPIPGFATDDVSPVSAITGGCDASGAQVVSFETQLGPGHTGVVHASTWIFLPMGESLLRIDCDDAFVAFLDSKRLLEQQMEPTWMRTRNWFGRDRWDQVHDGVHGRFGPPVTRVRGDGSWHRLVVAVDHGPRGWGFVLTVLPTEGKARPVATECRTGREEGAPLGWTLHTPIASNGFADALDCATPDPKGRCATIGGQDCGGVTDMAVLMQYEMRDGVAPVDPSRPIELSAGRVAILDLGRVELGFPELEFDAGLEGAVVDVGWSNLLPQDRALRYAMGNYVKYADRIRLRPGRQRWEPVLRRAFRYAHISCRSGKVTLRRLLLRRWYCPTLQVAEFECSDGLLNRIHTESVHAARLLMQETWQDCLRREMGTTNTQSFNYASIGALLALGAMEVTRHTLRTVLRTQERSGWFDSHGLSGLNQDESMQCLHCHAWVRDWWRYSGDEILVRELYPRLAENLEFFLKRCRRDGLLDQAQQHMIKPGDIVYLVDEISGLRGYSCPGSSAKTERTEAVPTLLLGPNALAAAAAASDAELASVAGFPRHAPRWNALAARIRAAANATFWDESRARYAASVLPDGTFADHHPLIDLYALRLGLPDKARRMRLIELLAAELGPERARSADWPCWTFGCYHHLLEVLFEGGRHSEAVGLIRILFGAWLEHGGTAMPEWGRPFDLISGKIEEDIEVHAYGLGALALFYTRLLGVQPAEPGFARVRIAPCPGGLAWARGSAHTPRGLVRVDWRVSGRTLRCRAEAPAGVEVEVVPPPGLELA